MVLTMQHSSGCKFFFFFFRMYNLYIVASFPPIVWMTLVDTVNIDEFPCFKTPNVTINNVAMLCITHEKPSVKYVVKNI